MTRQLLTLPVRLSARATRTVVRAGVSVPFRAIDLLSELRGALGSNGQQEDRPHTPGDTPGPTPRDTSAPERASQQDAARAPERPRQPTPEPPRAPEPPPEAEPVHVSEEPVLVEELAEPGAEDGAGASIRIDEPWEGYSKLTAQDVLAKLQDADPATLATVELFESGNKSRRTVLDAVRRELRSKNGRT